MADTSLTWAGICDNIVTVTGCSDAQALVAAASGWRRFLSEHPWSFLTPTATLSVGAAVAATVASGTTGGVITVATPAAGIFNASMVGLTLTISDTTARTCEITKYTSANIVTTTDTTGFTTKAISVESNGILDAPSDFGGMVSGFTYAYGQGDCLPPLRETTAAKILAMWRDDSQTDEAFWWALAPAPYVAATGQRWRWLFSPVFDEARTLNYQYRAEPDTPTDAAVFPNGGPVMVPAIEACGLAAAELLFGKIVNGPLEQNARIEIAKAIRNDGMLYRNGPGSAPSTEGY